MRYHCGRLVVMRPGLAVEAVIDTRIDVDLDLRATGKCLLHLRYRRGGHVLVLLGEMHDDRTSDVAGEVEGLLDADAVIANRTIDAGLRSRKIGKLTAETEAERPDLAGALLQSTQRLDRPRDVLDALGDVEFLVEREGLFPIGLGLAEFYPRLDPPEQVGTENDVALGGIELGDITHMRVDAEDLLDEHEAGPAARFRYGKVGAEAAAIGGDIDEFPRHAALPLFGRWREIALLS